MAQVDEVSPKAGLFGDAEGRGQVARGMLFETETANTCHRPSWLNKDELNQIRSLDTRSFLPYKASLARAQRPAISCAPASHLGVSAGHSYPVSHLDDLRQDEKEQRLERGKDHSKDSTYRLPETQSEA